MKVLKGGAFLELEGRTTNWVYHYTSRNTAIEKVLHFQQLRFNPFIHTNDPRESKMWHFTLMAGKPISNDTAFSLYKPVSEAELTDAVKHGCKLLCFSQDSNKRLQQFPESLSSYGCFRSRMWAQYGQGHSGVCLAFDKEMLDQSITEELRKKGRIYKGNVEYTENDRDIYQALGFNADAIRIDGLVIAVEKHLDLFYKQLFLQKDTDWKDENEYRWIIKTNNMNPEYVTINKSIRAVFLGIEFPQVYESLIIDLASRLDTPIYRIKWHNGIGRIGTDLRTTTKE